METVNAPGDGEGRAKEITVENTIVTEVKREKRRKQAVPVMPEVRHWAASGLEVREQGKTNEIVISGTPIVFDTPYDVTDMFGTFSERMAPGVAGDTLKRGADVRFLFNHDGLPLARSTSGTMTLTEADDGVHFEARLDARQQLANDLAVAIERGDVSQMSCGFIVARDEWDEDMENRTIHQFADLLDVSAVTYPASPTTAIQIAQRMALAAPVESRARLRRLILDERGGAVLSAGNKERVATAIGALHALYEAGGGNIQDLVEPDADTPPATDLDGDMPELIQDGSDGIDQPETTVPDGTLERSKSARVLQLQVRARRSRR